MILIILFILVVIIFFVRKTLMYDDLMYLLCYRKKSWEPYVKRMSGDVVPTRTDPLHICFVTLETRTTLEYIKIHNETFMNYASRYNYTYVFTDKCTSTIHHVHNPYWCKIYLLYDLIKTKKYDYVFWVDSDTCVYNANFNLELYLNTYNSYSIIASHDDSPRTLNAGVFGIKNDDKGIQFLEEWMKYYQSDTFKNKCQKHGSNELNGLWAGICYEQSWLNINASSKMYDKYLLVFPIDIVQNVSKCQLKDSNVFIIHLTSVNNTFRTNCFNQLINDTVSKDYSPNVEKP